MFKRDPGRQDTWILFVDLTLTHGMPSLHVSISQKIAFIKHFHISTAAELSGKVSHLHVSCHTSSTSCWEPGGLAPTLAC